MLVKEVLRTSASTNFPKHTNKMVAPQASLWGSTLERSMKVDNRKIFRKQSMKMSSRFLVGFMQPFHLILLEFQISAKKNSRIPAHLNAPNRDRNV